LSVFAIRRLLPDICRIGVAIATPSTAGIVELSGPGDDERPARNGHGA